jgi:sugar lactone lactonase YvrE
MTDYIRPDIEQRLVDALHREAEIAMTTTDTNRELERFETLTAKRRVRARVLGVAAAAALVAGGIYAATALSAATGHRSSPDITHPAPNTITTVTLPDQPSPLPKSSFSQLHGPDSLAIGAFGSVWATKGGGAAPVMTLYRLSPDGTRILGTQRFHLPKNAGDNPPPPFQVGSHLLVPASVHGRDAYLVLDAQGKQVASVRVPTAGWGVGDATGGWVVTGDTTVARLSANGERIVRTFSVPNAQFVSVAEGGGSLWLLDNYSSAVLRLDPSTGKVTGRSPSNGDPVVQMVYDDGAVFMSTEAYDLRRIDARTMKVTAVLGQNSGSQWAWQYLAVGPDGSLWSTPGTASVAQLDPKTLHVIRYLTPAPGRLDFHGGGSNVIVVTNDRVFISDIFNAVIYSIPRQ